MTSWHDLPNAHHIDWVLESVKNHPDQWDQPWHQARLQAWEQAWDQVWDQARDQAWDQAREKAWNQAWRQTRVLFGRKSRAVRDAIMALIAYDDAGDLFDMQADKLYTWAVLSENPAAVLLLPAVRAREQIHQTQQVTHDIMA